jgi:hypothetical protein
MHIHEKIKSIIDRRLLKNSKFTINDVTIICLNADDYNIFIEYEKENNPDFIETNPEFLGKKVVLSNSNGASRVYFTVKSSNKSIGVIGTAGRKDDESKLGVLEWEFMVKSCGKLIESTCSNILVSGGAAWADHVAVHMFLNNPTKLKLILHLPAEFEDGKFSESTPDGKTANFYHKQFSEKLGVDSLAQIKEAIRLGCDVSYYGGFKIRNLYVARDSELMLAFTFGDDKNLKDGGTKHTFEEFLRKEIRGLGFHVNLNDLLAYVF